MNMHFSDADGKDFAHVWHGYCKRHGLFGEPQIRASRPCSKELHVRVQ